ncbi:hypothetical protein [Bradyrhizobium sp. CCBAU 45389]|uniref:hypothetical protein n=1 Tax=Bradyrhizobium sp. CCBAU 45389 TaxID=858429 RepID=UPI002305564C|nr:hypothetical protein [Bradyrhizobium sp. CCBAU 45389]
MITQLPDDFRFSGPSMELCTLTVRVADLADRFRFTLVHWGDQLGPATAMLVKLESGRDAALTEFRYAIERHGMKGPVVEVEAQDVAAVGVAALVDDVLGALRLSREDTDWIAPAENKARALDLLHWWAQTSWDDMHPRSEQRE